MFIVVGVVLIILIIIVVLISLSNNPEQGENTAQKTDETTEVLANKETEAEDTEIIDNLAENNEVIIPEQETQPNNVEEGIQEAINLIEEGNQNNIIIEEPQNNVFRNNRLNPFTEDRSDTFPNIMLPSARPNNSSTIR